MTLLTDTHYLAKAVRYARPENSNDRLPVVYGDVVDGSGRGPGMWVLPCIDTTNHVYAFAGHEVISEADGNGVYIYENDLLLDPGLYSFDELNDYEGLGNIAIIDFATTKLGSVITARGKGKPTATGGAMLMENIIDIVYDFLTVESDFTSALFEATAKAKASQIFTAQGYKAAGVIDSDEEIWDIVIEMMASFLGNAYKNGLDKLVLEIDDGSISQYGQPGFIRRSDATVVEAKQRLANIINRAPANYAYSNYRGEFKFHTDDSAHADAASIAMYGTREPNTPLQFYWCRDELSVQTIQDIVVAKFKHPIFEIEIDDVTLKNLHLDLGDVFIYSAEDLYDRSGDRLYNHYWRTIGVQPDYQRGKIQFRALQTNYFLTAAHLADGSYLADGSSLAGNDRDTTIY